MLRNLTVCLIIELPLEIPHNSGAISALCENLMPLFDTILDNRIEMQALSSLRDDLLSMLMSGENRD